MTTYALSVTTSTSSPVYTRDMSTLDTVTVTVNTTGTYDNTRISAVVVSGPVTLSLAAGEYVGNGGSFTITPTALGPYSVKIITSQKFDEKEYAFVNGTISVPINPPDTTVTVAANTNIAWDATSVVIPLSNATNGDYYKITANGSTTALGAALASGTTANVNVTSGLPALGTSSLYQIYALRPTGNGGDNTYYICNGGATFTITRPSVSTSTTAVASDVTITSTATAASTNLISLTANQQYRILDGIYLRSIVITSNGSNTSLAITYTVTAPTYPTPGTSKTYTLETRLESSYGGDNIWVTADTFTLTREDYDVTPDSPNLGANITGAGLGMYYYSSYWTVTGIDTGITASVTSGHMSVNNGSWVTSATVYNGDIVRVRLLSSTSLSTNVSTTITAGGLSDAWTVTTRAGITVPLVPLVDQPINTLVETAPVTIAGLASGESRTISVFEFHYPGTQISINGGAWGNGGPVSNGDTVKGRHTTAATYGTTVQTFLLMPPDIVAPVKSTTRVPDVTPDPVNVGLDVAGRELGQFTPSATTFNITGMDNYTPENPVTAYARFSGDTPAYMSINNAAYTTAANVKNGDQLRVAMYASNSYSTTKTVNFLLGPTPHSDSWSVTTRAVDVNPATPNLGNDLTGIELGELTYSGSSTVLNIDPIDGDVPVTIPVSISGNSATFQVNGTGGWVTSANVSLNDTIQARMYSSPNYSTTLSTVLTLGTFSEDTDTWSVTTRAADEEPNTPQLGDNPPVTDPGTTKYSAIWTITGMDPAPATALATTTNGGTFQVNGTGDWVNSASVSGGNTIQVRLTASVAYSTSVSTILTVGGQSSAPFIVTTRDADVTPNDFTFIDENNVPLNTFKLSNIITVASVEIPVPVTVSGGSYSKNGGAYTTVTGSAQNGDYFQVAHTSSGIYNTATNTTLTIGGVSDTYTTTTVDFAGATYYVNTTVSYDLELNQMFVSLSGTGVGSPKLLNPGDRVGFKQITSTSVGNSSVSLFSADHWTSTSVLYLTNSYQYKYASSTIPVDVVDTVNYVAYRSGAITSTTKTSSFMGQSLQPDTTVTLDESTYVITSTATSHTIVITNAGTTQNGTITVYRVKDSNTTHESRTGYGSLTITDVPPNDGFPKTYTLEARVTTADGGSGLWTGITTYDVIATTTADQNDPTISTYGFAIYDHEGTAITSFNEGHSTLRDLFTSPVTALSTTGTTDISTGLSGITTSNCVILVEGVSSTGAEIAVEIPATFVGTNPVSVRLGRAYSAMSVKVTVSQYVGLTIGATADAYGLQILNGANNTVIDQNSVVYGVKEIIALNPILSTQILYQNDHTYFMYIQLVQGRYPASGGLPIPAISSSKSVYLIPPTLSNAKWPDGSYKEVVVYLPKAGAITGYYNLAMLVSSNTAIPSYYGGSAPTHGAQIFSATGALIWDSAWQQAVVNNVISANQFTTGVTQNGIWDVTTGYDGVTAPTTGGTFPYPDFIEDTMRSIGASRTSTGLNDMDPANTYLAGSSLSGNVRYHMGFWRDLEMGTEGYGGGGKHKLAAKITSFTSATITMFRYADGPLPSTEADRITRVSTSRHPEGNFIFFRIV